MSDKKDGGPAFPDSEGQADYTGGMTLCDYFAAKAMQSLAADYEDMSEHPESRAHYLAKRAYQIADAMLSEREGGGE